MEYFYKNKKLFLPTLLFLMFFPIGLYLLRSATPIPTNKVNVTVTGVPPRINASQLNDYPKRDLLEYIQNRPALSESDIAARNKIIDNFVNSDSSSVYLSQNISIEYIKTANLFQAEILNPDVEAAKKEAIAWFQNEGISSKGICGLPLTFYLTFELNQEFNTKNVAFNPLPKGC